MSQVIRISESLYQRLSRYAEGFDTPAQVIEKMINFYEDKNSINLTHPIKEESVNLEIVYFPENNVEIFKKMLITNQQAYIKIYKIDGETEVKRWNATNFSMQSSVDGNLRSGYLRNWRTKGCCGLIKILSYLKEKIEDLIMDTKKERTLTKHASGRLIVTAEFGR